METLDFIKLYPFYYNILKTTENFYKITKINGLNRNIPELKLNVQDCLDLKFERK